MTVDEKADLIAMRRLIDELGIFDRKNMLNTLSDISIHLGTLILSATKDIKSH